MSLWQNSAEVDMSDNKSTNNLGLGIQNQSGYKYGGEAQYEICSKTANNGHNLEICTLSMNRITMRIRR